MSTPVPPRIAVVGCGGVSRMHFAAYAGQTDRVRVVAACDPVPALLAEVEAQFGVPATFASLEEMLAGADFEIGVVCTPTPVRRAVVTALAAAGKHVFCEKPFADTYDEAAAMVAAAETAGVQIGVNQNFRYHYPFDIARRLIAEGRIGRVTSIVHQDLMLRRDAGWRTTTTRHAFSVMGVHWFDGLRWMLRDEAVSVRAQQRSSSAIETAGETDITAIVTFAGGTVATVTESFSCPVVRTDTVVIGETGALLLTYAGVKHFGHDKTVHGEWATPFPGEAKPGATLENLGHLATAVAAGEDPVNSGHDNLHTIALLDAAYRAADSGEVVALDAGLVPA